MVVECFILAENYNNITYTNYVCTEYACAQIKQVFALRVMHFCCTVMYVCNASKAKDDGM